MAANMTVSLTQESLVEVASVIATINLPPSLMRKKAFDPCGKLPKTTPLCELQRNLLSG